MESHFNPRSRKESDSSASLLSIAFRYFNPRSRKESDASFSRATDTGQNFNPRSRKESDPPDGKVHKDHVQFQSTLSQGERRKYQITNRYSGVISIHALARRATTACSLLIRSLWISIHALARRATLQATAILRQLVDFNPRSRKESDLLESL